MYSCPLDDMCGKRPVWSPYDLCFRSRVLCTAMNELWIGESVGSCAGAMSKEVEMGRDSSGLSCCCFLLAGCIIFVDCMFFCCILR